MSKKGRAPEVRTQLNLIKGKLAREGTTSAELVHILTRDHPKVVASERDDLIHVALMKLAAEACNGRTGVETTAQLEMFAEYATPKMITFRRKDTEGIVEMVHIAVGSLTIPDVREHVAESIQKGRSRRDQNLKELARLADDMEQYRTAIDSTIDDCWAAKKVRG